MAINRGASVRVEGLDEFRRELKKLSAQGPSLLKDANIKVAGFVVDKAQGRASGVGAQAAKAAGTLKPSRSGIAARVTGGGSIAWFNGAEFGAVKYHQFQPHRGTEGYFLFPTIREDMPEIIELYGDEISKVMRAAFPN